MPKGSFLSDAFEKLAELSTSTVKKTTQAGKQIVSPTKIIEKITGTESTINNPNLLSNPEKNKNPNHTKLNFEKLQQKYQNNEKPDVTALRNRLFQLVKSAEEKAISDAKRKEQERTQKFVYEEQEKKKREQERQRQEQTELVPQGKVRKSIFSRKKKAAQANTVEVKPSKGKQ